MKKSNIMPVLVLTVICLVSALLMAGVNMISAPVIEEAQNAAANEALLVVLPDGKNFKEIDITDAYPSEITRAYSADGGYVFEASVNGNKSGLVIMCGISSDGKVVGVEVISNNETPDYWKTVYPVISGTDGAYSGMTSDDLTAEIVSGATNSSNGVYKAVKAALDAYTVANGGALELEPEETLPRTDAEIEALAEELLEAEAGSLTFVEFEDGEYVKRILRDAAGKNYAVYTVVISQYGTPETETLVHITNTGVIKKAEKLTWKVSDAVPEWGYNPPSEERVDELFGDLTDKTADTIGGVDVATGATNTATNLVTAMKEAIAKVTELAKKDMPTPEEDVIKAAEALLGAEAGSLTSVDFGDSDYIKRVYKDKSGKNYAVYTVVISQYGTPETETLVHITNTGVIKKAEKLTWKVSDAVPEWGYNPPSEERVDELFGDLTAKTADTIGGVDVATGATNTATNLVTAMKEAIAKVTELAKNDMPTAEETVISLAETLLGAEAGALVDVTPDGCEYVRRVYRENELGYAVYIVVISENYGTVETETLLHVDYDGSIKGVKKLVWKTSDAMWGYVPPTDAEVDPFYTSLIGETLETIDGLSPVTNATNTTGNLVTSIKEALTVVEGFDYEPPKSPAARITGILILAFAAAAVIAYISTKKIIRGKKK